MMIVGSKLFGLGFLIGVTSVFAAPIHQPSGSKNNATLTVQAANTNKNSSARCSTSLQNCTVLITESTGSCLSQPGSISITNNSRVIAMNIRASATNSNFNTYVVQNNGCPASLSPGASCTISFSTNAPAQFSVPNVIVKGTNTNATLFDLQAFTCPPLPAVLGANPTTVNTTIGLGSTITVTNNSTSPAQNVQAFPVSPLTVQSTDCASILSSGDSCHITLSSTATTTQNVPINGTNTNTLNIPVTVLGAVAGAPTDLTSVVGDGQVLLTWVAPSNIGDSSITSYTITPYIGATPQAPITVGNSTFTRIITGLTNGVSYTFTVAANNASGAGLSAYTDSVTPVSGLAVNPSKILALSGLGSGTSRTLTVTNNSASPVTLNTVSVPSPALPGTTLMLAGCTSGQVLPAGASCAFVVTPGAPPTSSSNCTTGIAPTPSTITITPSVGAPVTANIVVLGYGCIYQSGYLFSIDDSTPATSSIGGTVAAINDQVAPSPGIFWSPAGVDDVIWGIGDRGTIANPTPNATSPYPALIVLGQANCPGPNDGFCASNNMLTYFSSGNTYSAGICQGTTDGGYLDWHLPAMCELGIFDPYGPSLCTPGSTNIQMQLYVQGIGNLVTPGQYWSSTEASNVGIFAWNRLYNTPSSQLLNGKANPFGVRCARYLAN